jgi:hypothetical protein
LFDLSLPVLLWAQAQPPPTMPSTPAMLALKRWCSSLTLCSPEAIPSLHGLWALSAGLAALLFIVLLIQGPLAAVRQLVDLSGHIQLVRNATLRVWRASRLVAIAIGFTVVSWTGSQVLTYRDDNRRLDLLLLIKSRALKELVFEHGILAAMTPLRDVVGLANNLPLVVLAGIVVFRAALDPRPDGSWPRTGETSITGARRKSPWSSVIWMSAFLVALYRLVARGAGNADLPRGGCLLVEVLVIPLLFLIIDGFLLGWILTELRNVGLDAIGGEDKFEMRRAFGLMPAAGWACLLAAPARYVATFVVLAFTYLPAWSRDENALSGQYVRWQLFGWGLVDLEAAALVFAGLAGAVAWSRGSARSALSGYRRLLAAHGGHLVIALVMGCAAAGVLSASAYSIVLLLPAQSWVLAAADSYSHFATLPVGLWLLAAFIELAERSLPVAIPVRPTSAFGESAATADLSRGRSERPALGNEARAADDDRMVQELRQEASDEGNEPESS